MRNSQDERARKIALFFLFSLGDERVALQAAQKAVAQFKANSGRTKDFDADSIRVLKRIFERHKTLINRDAIANATPPTNWRLAAGVSANAWLRFQKNASDQEVIALVLSRIVGFDETEIARGLGVSNGTVRYRVGKALRQLGTSMEKGA